MSGRAVVVVGLMGAGKTTVARLLAEALDRPLRDSDPDLHERYGASAAEQAARAGIEVLHAREARHLRDALAEQPPPVIAAAASVVDDPQCRSGLADAFVVWLDAPPPVLARRTHSGDHRPHHESDLEVVLAVHRERRAPWYETAADVIVDVSTHTAEESAAAALAALTEAQAARSH